MTPPVLHVTLFSSVEMRLGELPDVIGDVEPKFFVCRGSRKQRVYVKGSTPFFLVGERLLVLLGPSESHQEKLRRYVYGDP